MNMEWRLSLAIMLVTAMSSAALPAWAVWTGQFFVEYSPLSWVVAGFAGVFVFAIISAFLAWALQRRVRAKYDKAIFEKTGFIDPMATTFENKRIHLSNFVLPSDLFIEGKTFVNCEIIGPANLFLRDNNNVKGQREPLCDAVTLDDGARFHNGITVSNCTFIGCSFRRVTIIFRAKEAVLMSNLDWVNWLNKPILNGNFVPDNAIELEVHESQSPQGTGKETPR